MKEFIEWFFGNGQTTQKGGKGSGNFNHAGIQGQRGGSAPGGGRSMGNVAPPTAPGAAKPAGVIGRAVDKIATSKKVERDLKRFEQIQNSLVGLRQDEFSGKYSPGAIKKVRSELLSEAGKISGRLSKQPPWVRKKYNLNQFDDLNATLRGGSRAAGKPTVLANAAPPPPPGAAKPAGGQLTQDQLLGELKKGALRSRNPQISAFANRRATGVVVEPKNPLPKSITQYGTYRTLDKALDAVDSSNSRNIGRRLAVVHTKNGYSMVPERDLADLSNQGFEVFTGFVSGGRP